MRSPCEFSLPDRYGRSPPPAAPRVVRYSRSREAKDLSAPCVYGVFRFHGICIGLVIALIRAQTPSPDVPRRDVLSKVAGTPANVFSVEYVLPVLHTAPIVLFIPLSAAGHGSRSLKICFIPSHKFTDPLPERRNGPESHIPRQVIHVRIGGRHIARLNGQ